MKAMRKLRGLWLVVVVCLVSVWAQPDWPAASRRAVLRADWDTMGVAGAPTLTYNNQLVAPSGSLTTTPAPGNGGALTDATFTPTANVIIPTLGNYPNVTVITGGNTTVTPDAAPVNAARITAATPTNFKGTFTVNPTTGVVTITNAHVAGIYSVTVTAFNTDGGATKTSHCR